jgi:signal transduction histidine kinase
LRRYELENDGLGFTGRLGFWERDLQTGAVQWTGDVDDILGLPRGTTPPTLDTMLGLIVPEQRNEVSEAFKRSILSHREHYHVEYRCHRPDGREVLVRNEWSVESDKEGRPAVLRGIILDVTYRTRTKAKLRRQAELLELLYAVAACANEGQTPEHALHTALTRICTFGGWPVGHVLLVSDGDHRPGWGTSPNPRPGRGTPPDPRELVPTGVWHAVDPDRYQSLRAAVERDRYGVGVGAPGRVMRDGKALWVDLRHHSPLPAAQVARDLGLRAALDLPVLVGSETMAVIECFADDDPPPDPDLMQEMTHVAAQLGRVFERRRVDRLKDEFVSVVSHELRTPLTSIQGAIGLLSSGVLGPLTGEALEMACIARDGCGRLLRLVNELLDLQKLEYGTPTLHPEPLALGPIVEGAVAAARPHAAALGIHIHLDDLAPGARVVADKDRLAQVVSNLLSNAVKYTPEGEPVLVRATRGRTHVRVAVEDRGPGVPAEFRRSLFQKFSQADTSDARQKGGTGLGLAICKMIVERLDGAIAHEPREGGGARFYFELPEIRPAPH